MQGGKDAKLRLLNLANLSGQGGPGHTGGEIGAIVSVPQGGVVLTQPAVWINPADSRTWIFVVNGNGASGLRLNFDVNGNPSLTTQWQNAEGGTSAVVANNMVFSLSGGTVRALDPLSGNVLWSLARSGGFHWESLIVANGAVYATDGSNHLTAYAVGQSQTTTTLTSSANPAPVGANVTFTANVTGNAPTGSVAFTDGSSSISGCSATPLAGSGNTRTASCSTSSLAAGTHSIVATYSGDAANAGSASPPLSQAIASKTTSTTTLASSLNPSTVGARVVFTAGVAGKAPTGTVAFTDGTNTISKCAAVALAKKGRSTTRTARCTVSSLTAGTHTIGAAYGGDAANNGSSATLTQIVNP